MTAKLRFWYKKEPKMLINLMALAYLLLTGIDNSVATKTPASISLFETNSALESLPVTKLEPMIAGSVNTSDYREVKAQVFYDQANKPAYVVWYLFSPDKHGLKIARTDLNTGHFEPNYILTSQDLAQQPGPKLGACPEPSVQFMVFAPNEKIPCEQEAAQAVATFAETRGYKTVRLLAHNATNGNFISYISCPNLKGIFYDGDGTPQIITAHNGVIPSSVIANAKFQNVTNIWVACEAYNNPMKTAAIKTAHSQKFAAGINDLLIGPSDDAGKCAMIKALNGSAMEEAFWRCESDFDSPEDWWGFGGDGSDYFGNKTKEIVSYDQK
jgi:hypothetical protein